MSAAIRRAESYAANIQNARSFLQTQDGALAQLGKLLERMSELKALAHDVTKNGGDISNYETEYVQLQTKFTATTAERFNGINLFSPTATPDPLFLKHPEIADDIQISRPTLGELNTGNILKVNGPNQYEIVWGIFDWNSAKSDAESKGGYLATITSEQEFNTICQTVPEFNNETARPWLGGTDDGSEGNWRWVTGEQWSYTRWTSENPNNGGGVVGSQNYLWSGWGSKQLWDDYHTTDPLVNSYLLEKKSDGIFQLPWSDLHASIMQVANARAQNGAEQMRLEMAGDLNSTNILNMESAVSRIMDVDIAEESATLARSRVLQQAGTAMLAQANQSSRSILKLIEMN